MREKRRGGGCAGVAGDGPKIEGAGGRVAGTGDGADGAGQTRLSLIYKNTAVVKPRFDRGGQTAVENRGLVVKPRLKTAI